MASSNFTAIWSVDGSSQESTSFTKTDEGTVPVIDINSLATPCTNTFYTLSIDVSQIKFLVIVANADCTLKFNSSGAPTPTMTLKANEPYLWWVNAPWVNVLTVDVTGVYITNAATGTMDLTIRGIVDPTP